MLFWGGFNIAEGKVELNPSFNVPFYLPFNSEFSLASLKFGITEPIDLGIETRFWIGTLSEYNSALSLRLVYSPLSNWIKTKRVIRRLYKANAFVEGGTIFSRTNALCLKYGLAGSFHMSSLFAPITLELGINSLSRYYDDRVNRQWGPYLSLSMSLLGGEYLFKKPEKN